MTDEEKQRLIANIAGSLAQVSREDIIERSVANFRQSRSGLWRAGFESSGKAPDAALNIPVKRRGLR